MPYAAHASDCLDSSINPLTIGAIKLIWKRTVNIAIEIGVTEDELVIDSFRVIYIDFLPKGILNCYLN